MASKTINADTIRNMIDKGATEEECVAMLQKINTTPERREARTVIEACFTLSFEDTVHVAMQIINEADDRLSDTELMEVLMTKTEGRKRIDFHTAWSIVDGGADARISSFEHEGHTYMVAGDAAPFEDETPAPVVVEEAPAPTLTAEDKDAIIRAFWGENQGLCGATEGAKRISAAHGLPVNTVRGRQNKMYKKGERPWNLPPVPAPVVEEAPAPVVEDETPAPAPAPKKKRKAKKKTDGPGRGRKSKRDMIIEGEFKFPRDGHTCPCCGVRAVGAAEINQVFGFRRMKPTAPHKVTQSNCRACRKKKNKGWTPTAS